MTGPALPADSYYTLPIAGDFRQGDIYRDIMHLMLSDSRLQVLRTRVAGEGRTQAFIHDEDTPPKDGFHWEPKETVAAEGQLRPAIVLTHDCEIENEDTKSHRLMGLLRPLSLLSPESQDHIIDGRHIGRLYLPAWDEAGFPESYVDLRRWTTLREDALPEGHRIVSMTDEGRALLQAAMIRYLTQMYRPDGPYKPE